jgi:hypothetical protein
MAVNKTKKGKHPGGAPTKYRPEYCQKLIDHYDVEPYEDKDGKRLACKLPTLRNFAKSNGLGISTVYDWINPEHASYHAEFSDAFRKAKRLLKWFLVENGLNGCHNALYAKFVAINMTDMSDKQEHDHTITIEDKLRDLANGKD